MGKSGTNAFEVQDPADISYPLEGVVHCQVPYPIEKLVTSQVPHPMQKIVERPYQVPCDSFEHVEAHVHHVVITNHKVPVPHKMVKAVQAHNCSPLDNIAPLNQQFTSDFGSVPTHCQAGRAVQAQAIVKR